MTIDKNPEKIKKMFNELADNYDFMNNLISFNSHKTIKKLAVNNLIIPNNAKVLDCCTGTGDITKFIAQKNSTAKIIGIDFSEKMIAIAKSKNQTEQSEFIQADCTNLPFANETFDIITISFGLRNIENYNKAISEMYRVLKNDGILMHLDFGKNIISNSIFNFVVPTIAKIFYNNIIPYEYLLKSKDDFFSPNELIKLFQNQNFSLTKRQDFLIGIIATQIFKK